MTHLETAIDQMRRAATNLLMERKSAKDKAWKELLKKHAVEFRDLADLLQKHVNQEVERNEQCADRNARRWQGRTG